MIPKTRPWIVDAIAPDGRAVRFVVHTPTRCLVRIIVMQDRPDLWGATVKIRHAQARENIAGIPAGFGRAPDSVEAPLKVCA